MLVGEHKPGIGGSQLLDQKPKPNRSNIPQGKGNAAPAWVAFDRQVLVLYLLCVLLSGCYQCTQLMVLGPSSEIATQQIQNLDPLQTIEFTFIVHT